MFTINIYIIFYLMFLSEPTFNIHFPLFQLHEIAQLHVSFLQWFFPMHIHLPCAVKMSFQLIWTFSASCSLWPIEWHIDIYFGLLQVCWVRFVNLSGTHWNSDWDRSRGQNILCSASVRFHHIGFKQRAADLSALKKKKRKKEVVRNYPERSSSISG